MTPSASEFSERPQYKPSSLNKPPKQWIPILLIALLAASWIYFFSRDASSRNETNTLQQQLLRSDSGKATLEGDYRQTLQRIDELTVMNTGMDSIVRSRNKEIEIMKDRIRVILGKEKSNAEELAEAKRLINALNEKINGYIDTVMSIRLQNTLLRSEKDIIATQKEMLQQRYEANRIAKEKVEEKLDIASTLVASQITLTTVHEKNSGKEKETATAKRTHLLRCRFDVYNRVNEAGKQALYIIVTDPFGQVVSDPATGSVRFTTRREGERVYTLKTEVDFTAGEVANVAAEWKPEKKFAPGLYIIEIYHNGFRIGEVEKTLR